MAEVEAESRALQEVLQRLERPLLSTSVHVEKDGEQEYAEGAVMMDNMRGCGLDFVVDCGMRVRSLCSRLLHTCIVQTAIEHPLLQQFLVPNFWSAAASWPHLCAIQ